MSRKNYVEDLEFDAAYGMDSTSALTSMKPGFVRTAYNVNLGQVSGYIKRDGFSTVLSSTFGSKSILAGQEYKDSTATLRNAVFATDGSGSGGEVAYMTAGGTSLTSLVSSLSGTARGSFCAFGDLLGYFNGADAPVVIDGTSSRQLGITPPAAPSLAQAGSGSLTLLGSYVFAITYYNSVTGAESSPSGLTSFTLTGGNQTINLTFLAGSATTADTIRIWRTVANGNTLFLAGTAVIGATSFSSTIADSALGRPMEDDNTRITTYSSTVQYPVVVGPRIFVATDTNEVRWSKIGYYRSMWESFEAKAVAPTMGSLGEADGIVGMNAAGDVPVVLKAKSIGRLEPVGIPNLTGVVDNVVYQYHEISAVTGAVSHFAACQVDGTLLFLGRDNVYATDGARVWPIADTMSATIKAAGFSASQVKLVSAVNDTKNKRVVFSFFNSSSATSPNYQLIGDYQMKLQGQVNWRWTMYRPGTNVSTHTGLRIGCLFQVTNTTSGQQDIYFGNCDSNGQIYKMNTGSTDNTKAIYYETISRPYALGRPNFKKLVKSFQIQAQGDGNDYDLSVGAIYDLASQEESTAPLELVNGGDDWDDGDWDSAYFADESSKNLEYATHRKAYWVQVVIRQTQASAPVTIYGWGVSGSLFNPS